MPSFLSVPVWVNNLPSFIGQTSQNPINEQYLPSDNNAFIKEPAPKSIFDLCSSNVQSNDEQSSSTSQLQTKDGDNLCIHGTSTIIKRKLIKEEEENYPQMVSDGAKRVFKRVRRA